MKGQSTIMGNLLILPLLIGIALIATACFTLITDENREPSRGMNLVPQSLADAGDSQATETSSPDRSSDNVYELEVIADPSGAADFLVNSTPGSSGAYMAGTTVTIDVRPNPGWEIKQWLGPVYDISGEAARVSMEGDLAILVRLVKSDSIDMPPDTSRPASSSSP